MAKQKDLNDIFEQEKTLLKAYRSLDYQKQIEAAQQRRAAYLAKFRKGLNNNG